MMDLGTTLASFALEAVRALAVIVASFVGAVVVLVLLGWGLQRVVRATWAWLWR